MNLSVVIPTRNRPALLREAITSVTSQRGPAREIVIVDDASDPPVNVAQLESDSGHAIRVVRNEHSCNVCVARDQGVQASHGELILHLDDDDRLADGALISAWDAVRRDSSLEVLFLGVRGFGPDADRFDVTQAHGVQRVLSDAVGQADDQGLIKFGAQLFPALLTGVPMAFQRIMVQRAAWDRVSNFRRRIYAKLQSDPAADPLFRVPAVWNESEWALYASVLCTTAFLDRSLYLQRCAGQGYFSAASQEPETASIGINIMNHLSRATRTTAEFAPWLHVVREHRARAHANRAYWCLRRGDRIGAMASTLRALSIVPCWKYLVLFARSIVKGDMPH